VVVGDGTNAEIELSVLLAQYAALLKQKNRRSRLVIANLQKRLLSSIEAFARTLAVHAKSVGARTDQAVASASPPDDDEYGEDEGTSDERSDSQMTLLSCGLAAPSTDARSLLERMTSLAEQSRRAPAQRCWLCSTGFAATSARPSNSAAPRLPAARRPGPTAA